MHRWLQPAVRVATIYEIDVPALHARGIRGIILDLDNTIVPWGAREASPDLVRWVGRARDAGLRLCIVSNSSGARVAGLAGALGLPVLAGARKPASAALRRALAMMDTSPAATALVGDQVFTDVLGGNRLGLHTILVRPQSPREFFLTRLVRIAERVVLGRGK